MTDAVLPLPRKTLRVGELTRYLKYVIEHDEFLASLSVEGEISDLSKSPSGHVYFTLKDELSQVGCVLFRREALRQTETVRNLRRGISVVVHGYLTVYEVRGSCQVYVERIVLGGDGAMARRFVELKERLEAEGLFAPERKRSLPAYPRRIALITSLGSQAYHDVLHRLGTQYPRVSVIEAGVTVQGEGAADEMALAIDIVNRLTDAEVILLVRGGGAPEELAAFNDERLARAIFASRIPVVTGVGHETDHTIADFVADRRAATPSLAVAVAVPDLARVVERAAELHSQLRRSVNGRLQGERRRWVDVNRSLLRSSPGNRLRVQRSRHQALARAVRTSMEAYLKQQRARHRTLEAQLRALDPLAILSRGYAVLTDTDTGQVISHMHDAVPGRRLRARVTDGEFGVEVRN